MKPVVIRLSLAALLFFGWIGYLSYLAATSRHTVVLSRPQFLTSSLDVIAAVERPDGNGEPGVKVLEVHWPRDDAARKLEGTTIPVADLADCEGYGDPGEYILPLNRDTKGIYHVAPTPPSPGYGGGRPRIYPLTLETRQQLQNVPKPEALAPPPG
jgi:hypothetical protein